MEKPFLCLSVYSVGSFFNEEQNDKTTKKFKRYCFPDEDSPQASQAYSEGDGYRKCEMKWSTANLMPFFRGSISKACFFCTLF